MNVDIVVPVRPIDPDEFSSDRTIIFVGNGTAGSYAFATKVGSDITGERRVERTDRVSNRAASGVVAGGSDAYSYTGRIEALAVSSGVTVYVDGEAVDTATYEQLRRIEIVGAGEVSSYEFTVADRIVSSGGLGPADQFTVDTASGVVSGGTDVYYYRGPADPTSLTVDGNATVYINGTEVDPDAS